jgi:hypothetical protein
MKDLHSHFRSLIERAFPEGSRILIPEGGPELIILATWRLATDPHRPSKRSRLVRIVVSQEAIEDYARGSDGARLASDERFLAWIRGKLADFDPNHDSPLGVEPPAVAWLMDTIMLNG